MDFLTVLKMRTSHTLWTKQPVGKLSNQPRVSVAPEKQFLKGGFSKFRANNFPETYAASQDPGSVRPDFQKVFSSLLCAYHQIFYIMNQNSEISPRLNNVGCTKHTKLEKEIGYIL